MTATAQSKVVTGYTTGVYDLFHVGHLNLLERARAACDRLIVGVTTDDLAAARKGRPPFVPLAERLSIIAALRCVDEVVVQADMDKMAAWNQLRFQRMFVGSDWQGHPDWTALETRFATVGVKIVYFPYTEHISSTRLRALLDKSPI
jgi:glycerol-3-phosphate cytidylyltransferase